METITGLKLRIKHSANRSAFEKVTTRKGEGGNKISDARAPLILIGVDTATPYCQKRERKALLA